LSFLRPTTWKKPDGDDRRRPGPLDPELIDMMPASPNQPYDMKKVISAVVDDGEYMEVTPIGPCRHCASPG